MVRPHARAGVEIKKPLPFRSALKVRPHARAGVEMRSMWLIMYTIMVRPHARAGVEIARANCDCNGGEFALMRGRELKCQCFCTSALQHAFALMRGRELK